MNGGIKMERLSLSTICKRIAVQQPYFAFSELLALPGGAVLGAFSPEQSIGSECGPISSAELGRHLAILGSCAAALDASDDMTYYLASKGQLKLMPLANGGLAERRGIAVATVTSRNRRSMIAEVVGHCGSITAHLWCEYQVLSRAVFSRIFSGHYTGSVTRPTQSPYRTPIDFELIEASTDRMVVRTVEVDPQSFAGHFDEYPSWPVAILADTFSQVRTALLHSMLDQQVCYRVGYLNVDALQLAPAIARLTFEVKCTSSLRSLGRFVFLAKVTCGDTTVATMESEVYATEHVPTRLA